LVQGLLVSPRVAVGKLVQGRLVVGSPELKAAVGRLVAVPVTVAGFVAAAEAVAMPAVAAAQAPLVGSSAPVEVELAVESNVVAFAAGDAVAVAAQVGVAEVAAVASQL
jgi:hypothetical protein